MGIDVPVIRKKAEEFFLDRLPEETRRSFLFCTTLGFFRKGQWYLAGGTALALQVGHRQSVDLDFFTPQKRFGQLVTERALVATGKWETSFTQSGTLYGKLYGAKMSLIAYPFFVPRYAMARCGFVRVLAPPDIAAMKIIAISQRGRKRDFVDLYWYCTNKESLRQVIERAVRQYPGQKHNVPHFIKSLTYFTDAEDDPMPTLFFDASWKRIKEYFRSEAPKLMREFLRL